MVSVIPVRVRGAVVLAALAAAVPAYGQSLSVFEQRQLAPAAGGQMAAAPAGDPQQAGETGPVRRLSIDDAVAMALEQNLSIQVQRISPRIQDLSISQARSAWTPNVFTSLQTRSQDTPPNSFLSGGQEKVADDFVTTSLGVDQLLPWGGSYRVSWDSQRRSTNNIFTNFDPVLQSNIDVTYTQPLLRNFRIDPARQQLLVSRRNREISDIELRQTVVSTVRNVKNAYWELAFAIASLDVQRQSLELARQSLRDTRTRVEVGTMAPIDIVEAEAEVARNEEAVIVAEAEIQDSEDQLRALIMDPSRADFWNVQLEPTDTPTIAELPIDIDAAVERALSGRTDLLSSKKQLEVLDVNARYFRNQTLPDINLQANYFASGLGGTQLVRGEGFPGDVIGTIPRSFGSVLSDVFGNAFPTWAVGVQIGYPIGTSTAEASLARTRLQRAQTEVRIRNLELQVATQVREVGRQVSTNRKRVDATSAARLLAERRLEAEQKKFSVGMSTSFVVFQAQRDLAAARNNELRAILDYNRSLVDFEAIQEASIGGGASITLVPTGTTTGTAGGTFNGTTGTGQTVP